MNTRKLVKDLFTAFGAQGVSFLASCVTTLIVPKILGVEEFAYWQLFVFYTSYVSFFQLGLNDGVNLRHGGETLSQIDKRLIRSELCVGLGYQSVAVLLIACYGLFLESDGGRTLVIVAAAAYLLLSNTAFYFAYVFQAMNETRVASYSTVINRGFYLIALVVCLLLRVESFFPYVFLYLAAQALSLCYCLWKGRIFLKAKMLTFKDALRETGLSMKLGFILTIANITGSLIIGISRIVIDSVWGLSAFGEVSLSLSIVNFALTFISQVAMVAFPALRLAGRGNEAYYYAQMRDLVGAILPVAFLFYVPIRWLVGMWLPQYYESLVYLAVLFPVCIFEAQADLVVVTFMKVRSEPRALFVLNLAALGSCVLAQVIALTVFHTPFSVVVASLVGIFVRYAAGVHHLGTEYRSRNIRLVICTLAISILFMISACTMELPACFIACVFLFAVHSFVNRTECEMLVEKAKQLASGKRLR